MQVFEIPKRKERIELMKKDFKTLNLEEQKMRRELEGAIRFRLTEKIIVSAISLMWLVLGVGAPTPMCELLCIPFAIITLFGGLWIV